MSFELAILRSQISWYDGLILSGFFLFSPIGLSQYFTGVDAGPVHEVASFIGVVALIVFVARRWLLADADGLMLKSRAQRSVHLMLVLRVVTTLYLMRYAGSSCGVLVKSISVFLLPLSSAKENHLSKSFLFYIVANMVMNYFYLQADFWKDGWQWLFVSIFTNAMLLNVASQRSEISDAMVTLESTCDMLRKVMSILCDGYFLLDRDGRITNADQKAAYHLELGDDVKPQSAPDFASFVERSGPDENPMMRNMWEGLRAFRLRTGSGKRYEVEAYAIPWNANPKGIRLILGDCPCPPDRLRGSSLCGIRIVQELHLDDNIRHAKVEEPMPPREIDSVPSMLCTSQKLLGGISEEDDSSASATSRGSADGSTAPRSLSVIFNALSDGCPIICTSPEWLCLWSSSDANGGSLRDWMGTDVFKLFEMWLQPFTNRTLSRPWHPKTATSCFKFRPVFQHHDGMAYKAVVMVTLLPHEHFQDDGCVYEAVLSLQCLRPYSLPVQCPTRELTRDEESANGPSVAPSFGIRYWVK